MKTEFKAETTFAIDAENISKRFYIGKLVDREATLLSSLHRSLTTPLRRMQRMLSGHAYGAADLDQELWALQNLNFKIKKGEVVGFIGRNGAGKSTLLKILTRVTSPTTGSIKMRGRVGALLEVGTGFHPELSGRENVYMNGAILGMSQTEIKAKFDQIVEFSGIDKFIDTPLKYYSSGMQVRLAFSVAAHLEPEILVIDEVLSVGDYAFQKKCLGKVEDVSQSGRTVLFVSHQMETVQRLCTRAILLQEGRIVADGEPRAVIAQYLETSDAIAKTTLTERKDRKGDGRVRFVDTWMENAKGHRVGVVQSGEDMSLVASFRVSPGHSVQNVGVAFALYDRNGIQITDLSNLSTGEFFYQKLPETGEIRCRIPRLPLMNGRYRYNVILRSGTSVEDHVIDAGSFEVENGDFFGTGKTLEQNQGMFLIPQSWSLEEKSRQRTTAEVKA